MNNFVDILKKIIDRFGSPFLPEGFIRLEKSKVDDSYLLYIGDRDVQFTPDGKFIGSSINVGDAVKWFSCRVDRCRP